MKKLLFLIPLCLGIIQAQAPHRFGAIDGVSIPDRALNYPRELAITSLQGRTQQPSETEIQSVQERKVCAGLHSVIAQAVEARANRELGVYATDAEVEAYHKNMPGVSKESQAFYRERLQTLVDGLSAVYDHGQDPQQVYQQLVAPHNISKESWAQNVYLGKSKEVRDRLARDLAGATPEGFAKIHANFNARPAVEDEKRKAALDALLAASDPKFKAYLDEWNANTTHPSPGHTRTSVGGGVKEYLEQKRGVWWKAETAKLNVTLSDPSLYAACGLPAMSVTVPRQ
jgi:hypothetical protein